MNAPARRSLRLGLRFVLVLAVGLVVVGVGGCRGDARRGGRGAAEGDGTGADAAAGAGAEGGTISLSNQDLAPMDGYIRRRFWVLGDDVEIVASKSTHPEPLHLGAHRLRQARRQGGRERAESVLTPSAGPAGGFSNAPRVLVGTGISVLARRTLTIRFTRTTSPDLPVRIRIAANGDARLGMGNQVSRRDPSIVLGAQLRRVGGAYLFEEQ
jgi:hypothetical protein